MFDIHTLYLHTANIVINRFRRDSSLPPGDSHLLDVGLTSPTCRFPPDLFLCLGRRKRGVHPDAVAPRRPGLGGKPQRKQQFAGACPLRQQHRRHRCWGARLGGIPEVVGWWSLRGEKEGCGRCCRAVCLSVFLVRKVWLLECHWNDLNSYTAGNFCPGWFSNSKYRLIHVCTKITRDLKSTKIWHMMTYDWNVEGLWRIYTEREREIGSLRNCATVNIGNCRLSNRMSFSSVIHPAKDQSQCQTLPDSSVSRLHTCVERTIAFLLVTECLTFTHCIYTQQTL